MFGVSDRNSSSLGILHLVWNFCSLEAALKFLHGEFMWKSILREINPEYSLEGLRLKRKFQCFGHLM